MLIFDAIAKGQTRKALQLLRDPKQREAMTTPNGSNKALAKGQKITR